MIDLDKPIWFYDDRSKDKEVLSLQTVFWKDESFALCSVKPVSGDNPDYEDQPFLFKLDDGWVANQDYNSWYATNDISFLDSEDPSSG